MLCFRKLSVAEKVIDKRRLSMFSVGKTCLRVPKTFVGEHFRAVFEKTSGSEELYG